MWRKAIVLGALLATGCNSGNGTSMGPGLASPAQPPPNTQVPPGPVSPALSFSNSESGLQTGVVARAFNFGQMNDLWVRVTVPTLQKTGVTVVKLKFMNPLNEIMYQVMRVYSTDPLMKEMPMPGTPSPQTVFRAKTIPGGYALDAGLPLAGTTFTRFATTAVGDWTVEAQVDGVDHVLVSGMSVTFTR